MTLKKQDTSPQETAMQEKQKTMPLLAYVGEKLCTDYQLYNFPTVNEEDEETHVLLNMG